jgi:glutamate-1-semialdehyde 2,1-aminomutase
MAAVLTERGQSPLLGGCLGTFRLPDEFSFVAARGSGAMIISTDGTQYLDHVLGSGPMVLGHAHPRVIEAIQRQAERGTTFYQVNDQALLLAERIARHVPCAEGVKLVGGGSEATFYALRIARAVTGRQKALKFEGAYHGHNDYSLHSLRPFGDASSPNSVPASAGIPAGVTDTVVAAPFNDAEATRKLIDEHAADLAAVIVEPVQRSFLPEPGFLEQLRAACDRVGALLIFDEVVTGFRMTMGGAQEAYGVLPDLCALGKVVGGGLPLGALAGRRDLIEVSVPGTPADQYVYLSGTLNGNPLAAAAGLATLEVLEEEDGCGQMARAGQRIIDGLVALARELSVPLQVIGPPSFPQPVFGQGSVTDPRSLAATDVRAATAFGHELLRRHVFVHPGGKLYVSTAHTSEHGEQFLSAAREAITAMRTAGVLGG